MYQWHADEYRTSSSNQKKWALELLSKLDLKGSERVLDIGCGDGEITVAIAQRVPEPLREEFIHDIVAAHARLRPPDGDGSIHFTMVRLEVEATQRRSKPVERQMPSQP